MLKILIPLCSLLFFGCELADELTKFDFSQSTTTTIPSTTVIGSPISIATPTVQTNSTSEFDSRGSNAENINSIKLKSLTLSIQSPATANFDFLSEIRIYIQAGEYSELLLASIEDLENTGATSLDLDTTDVELRNYISEDSYQLRVEVVTDETIAEDIELEIENTFEVDAKLL